MRAQEATPLLALAGRHRQQIQDDDIKSQERQTSFSAHATSTTPPLAARRWSQPPSLAVIHEGGSAHEWEYSSSFSSLTQHDVYENYNALSAQVVWPPQGMSWPPHYLPTSSSSSSSSSSRSFDIKGLDEIFRTPSHTTSRKLRQMHLLLIFAAMVSVPIVALVSMIQSKEYFDYNKGGRRHGVHSMPTYSQRHHRHFHRIVEMSRLTNLNYTDLEFSSDAVFDISTVPTNISFGDLASMMVPIYFQAAVDMCISTIDPLNNSTIDIMPDEVFVLRKTILKTRDLLDIFSPVYPKKVRLLGHEKKDKQKNGGKEKRKGKNRSHSEEVLHKMRMNHHSVVDVWKILRRFLDDGYMLIGDFQDLAHAKLKYTPERLRMYQGQVWNWKEEFVAFVAQNYEGIMVYLSHACPDKTEKREQRELSSASNKTSSQSQRRKEREYIENTPKCSYSRSKLSHLFWKDTPISQLPDGNADEASSVLGQLGSAQLNRTLVYLGHTLGAEDVVGDQAVNKDVHKLYHNLRKEIRSFLDSVDLFGQLLFPGRSSEQHNEDVLLLRETKKLLGDLNDEVVAYSKYLQWNEYPEEQLQLKSFITVDWRDFRNWAQEVDLNGKLQSLADEMTCVQNEGSLPKSIGSYLNERKKNPTRSLVIGNDAGDADSIISAICLAFLEGKTPIISISRDAFYERPEVGALLHLAGFSNASADLLFIEDLKMILDSSKDNEVWVLTLVDHNVINDSLHKFRRMFEVLEIVDHHTDENLYTDTCFGARRNVAYENNRALVSSTTTLVAELLMKQTRNPPVSLSTLLLGVILLDSVNLDKSIGKVTPRDRDAISNILTRTNWTDWSSRSLLAFLKPSAGSQLTIDTNQLFSYLEQMKYSPELWNSFDVSRALGYDYKAFHYGGKKSKKKFGISTILMPGNQFMKKEGFLTKTAEFMRSKEVEFLGIMLTFYNQDSGVFCRQFAFCSSRDMWRGIGDNLIVSKMYTDLALKEIVSQQLSSDEIDVHIYEQGNVTYSRKQIGPMMINFFAREQGEE